MSRLTHYESYSPGLYGLPHMGEVIASFRRHRGWETQEAFAIVCGVDKQTVGYWENQRYLADMDRRIFLCKVLKITPPTLLGLTWHSIVDDNQTEYARMLSNVEALLQENAYALYEDILTFAHDTSGKGVSPEGAYRFHKHQEELEALVKVAPEIEKDVWKDLLSRFYQHSTFTTSKRRCSRGTLCDESSRYCFLFGR
ncbi:hypothetical protein KDW_38670 [Dictyobacter vulcani]|uniref:HTH cro/C1-type domain-containing protein n=1 Tax=Dictyobacter vulcani TaxID=2607529 RepID=A0A5J4KPA6_9CHLR|nr:helix-turn-helix transcriptional regulator [Dictyobacter vulcani]GER89705.1 hypothetical protein KDW_38670 [Dictyobacter vulcani]